ncbi:MAG: hypothetical protein ABGZ35_32315 [Planctomycetaceae bacterium]
MGKRIEIPDDLLAVVTDAMDLLSTKVASAWSYKYDGKRAVFSGPGLRFTVRDKYELFEIVYEYEPEKRTKRLYDHETTVRFLLELFHRPAVRKA